MSLAPSRPMPVSLLAIPFSLVAFVMFSLQDAGVKSLIGDAPIWQLMLVRSVVVLAVALAIGRATMVRRIVTSPNRRQLFLRAVVMLVAWLLFYEAARGLPLAQLTTLYFVSPFLVTLAAGPLLGERVTPLQWVAVALGFTGVATAAGLADFTWSPSVGLVLAAALLWAVALLMLRRMSPEEGSLIQVASSNAVFLVASGSGLAFEGFALTPAQTGWMALIGLVGGLAQFCLYEGARRAPAAVIATLEYTSILCSFAFGWLFFGEVPGRHVFVGAAIVVVSGLLVVAGTRFSRKAPDDADPRVG